MVLTKEQKEEILRKYIDPSKDFIRAGNGKILVSLEASQRIAKAFNLKIGPDAQFEPVAISNYIIQREQQKLAAAASISRFKEEQSAIEQAKIDKVIACIKESLEQNKNDFEIAISLQNKCSDLSLSVIINGIKVATQTGVLTENNIVRNHLITLTNRNAFTKRVINITNGTKDKTKIAVALANEMVNLYSKKVLTLGHMQIALIDSGLDDDVIDATMVGFYKLYEPIFLEQYNKLDLSRDILIDTLYKVYLENDMFDSKIILGYVEKLNKENINIDDFAYALYQKEGDEQAVFEIMMIKGLSVEEYVQRLKDLGLQYPPICLKRTFDLLKKAYALPYDEILEKYMSKENTKETEAEDLVAVKGVVSTLTEDGESFEHESEQIEEETIDLSETEVEEELQPRRLQIVKKEKEVKEIEKKKTLATLLIGAGFIPVAVLSWVFKVDPLVASKNCVTALSQLMNGSMGLKDILPSATQLTTLLAGMGTTFVGFLKYLKHKGKLKETKEELEELEAAETVVKGRR